MRTASNGLYVDQIYQGINCSGPCPPATNGTGVSVVAASTTANIDFAIQVGGMVNGTIRNALSGLPITQVEVGVYDGGGNLIGRGITDASGAYLFLLPHPGTYYVSTRNYLGYMDQLHAGIPCPNDSCVKTSGTPVIVPSGGAATVDFSLTPSGGISGLVTSADNGAGIGGIVVEAYDSAGTLVASAVTAASGQYLIPGLTKRAYFVRTNYSSVYIDQIYRLDPIYNSPNPIDCIGGCPAVTTGSGVSVGAGAVTPWINFPLLRTGVTSGTITGTVREAVSGLPLAGVTVTAFTYSGETAATAVTDAAGGYTVEALPRGTYRVQTGNPESWVPQTWSGTNCTAGCSPTTGWTVPLVPGSPVTGVNFSLVASGIIAGTIRDARTAAPLAGVTVLVFDSTGKSLAWPVTDAAGAYSVPGLTAGTYFAKTRNRLGYLDQLHAALLCPGAECATTSGTPIPVASGVRSTIDFPLQWGGTISGVVTNRITGGPVFGVGVYAIPSTGSAAISPGGASLTGQYTTVTGIPTGVYFIRAGTGADYIPQIYAGIDCVGGCPPFTSGTPVVVTAGESISNINFSLMPSRGALAGTVRSATTGAPLQGIFVDVYASGTGRIGTATSDASGGYDFPSLAPGHYFAVTRNYAGYVDQLYLGRECWQAQCTPTSGTAIAVTGGTTTTVDFALVPGGTISGAVTTANGGAPIEGVLIAAFNSRGAFARSALTNARGEYTITGLPTGTHYVGTHHLANWIDQLFNGINCLAECPAATTGTAVNVSAGRGPPASTSRCCHDRRSPEPSATRPRTPLCPASSSWSTTQPASTAEASARMRPASTRSRRCCPATTL